jgi:hypothetical protein
MPFMDEAAKAKTTSIPARFTYGPIYRYLRRWEMKHNGDKEPAWRKRGNSLETGYQPRHYAR